MSVLDRITRVCKNSAGDIIATQVITVRTESIETRTGAGISFIDPRNITIARFGRRGLFSVRTQTAKTTSGNATITTILTTGGYDIAIMVGNDVDYVTYNGDDNGMNNIDIPVSQLTSVYVVGDIV